MILGVDIDGTIKDTQRAAVNLYNEKFNKSVKLEDVKEFHLDKHYDLTPKEGKEMWRSLEERIYTLGVPLEHASEVLNRLAEEGHEIYFITARPALENITEVTKKWLREHNFPYDGNNLIMGSSNKGKIARELSIDLFFEDAPVHIDNLLKNEVNVVIIDAAYNQEYRNNVRIFDWRDIYGLVSGR